MVRQTSNNCSAGFACADTYFYNIVQGSPNIFVRGVT